ncbi:MAG TPA: polysaccharide deacetylase family protein [Conexibacter sp.]|nr:polysaccharide deacetylase family protein [Conexibacter sp.]
MRRPGATATGAALAAAGAWSLPALAPLVPSLCRPLGIPRTLPGDAAAVALTFDDGPHPRGTPAVLDALAQTGARATFFLIGEQVRRSPALAAEIVAAGHAVALHGDRHRLQLRVGPRALAADLDRGHATIAEATGVAPRRYRPPFGVFSPAGLAHVRRRGWAPLLWSRWGHDWRLHRTPAQIADELTGRLQAGDVLLLHDADDYSQPGSWQRTAAALPAVLAQIERRGLTTVAL